MANAIQAYVNTFNSALAGGISTSLMFSFAISSEFYAELPIKVHVSANLSISGEVYIFKSSDGGANYESVGRLAEIIPSDVPFVVGGAAEHNIIRNIELENGQYKILVITNTGTAGTFSVELLTARLVTAYA